MTTLDRAKSWLEQDPDPQTRAELAALIPAAEAGDAAAMDDLHDRFDTRLTFGTAGLRGALGAGSNRMNRVLVAQAATGFARWLLAHDENASVVIGYDGRVNSDVFARDSAELMAAVGVRVMLMPRALPTPVLAFAVRHLGVSAGVMVTASHNPPNDNGYKVYLGGRDGGAQIVAPTDAAIHEAIVAVADTSTVTELPRSTEYDMVDESVIDAYVARTASLVTQTAESAVIEPVRFVYTAMHGVGWEVAQRTFAAAGLGEAIVVAEQIEPDGTFPTVAFPNPEEPGAMDLAYATARAAGAELIIANDPDADRLAVAIPDETAPEGWRRLSGNEVGALLGLRVAERLRREERQAKFAASLVSSPALLAVANAYGVSYSDTLTGFKWISRVGGLAYGFEEALGYLVDPDKVRDKDGISAAVDLLALAGELKAAGRTIADHQREFDERFGAFASAQVSLRVTDLSRIGQIMASLRQNPPTEIGGVRVTQVDDFAGGFGVFPPSDLLRFWMHGGARVIVRPSGTEPKVKVYIDASSDQGSVDERRAAAAAQVAQLEQALRTLIA